MNSVITPEAVAIYVIVGVWSKFTKPIAKPTMTNKKPMAPAMIDAKKLLSVCPLTML